MLLPWLGSADSAWDSLCVCLSICLLSCLFAYCGKFFLLFPQAVAPRVQVPTDDVYTPSHNDDSQYGSHRYFVFASFGLLGQDLGGIFSSEKGRPRSLLGVGRSRISGSPHVSLHGSTHETGTTQSFQKPFIEDNALNHSEDPYVSSAGFWRPWAVLFGVFAGTIPVFRCESLGSRPTRLRRHREVCSWIDSGLTTAPV